jgi:hypothetical protein
MGDGKLAVNRMIDLMTLIKDSNNRRPAMLLGDVMRYVLASYM